MIVLKCIQPYFSEVYCGRKAFELRINDRDYKVGMVVKLASYCPKLKQFTGWYVDVIITYVLFEYDDVLKSDYVIFSFKHLKKGKSIQTS